MSENITIKEGGIAQGFGGVTVLRTNNGDGYDQWVPKKDVNTKSVTFKKNGKYATRAYLPDKGEKITVDGDVYGYSSVTVSVVNKTSGKKKKKKKDGTEYDAPYTVDVDDAGNLTEKELPTSIKITTKPDRTRFREGEEINTNGMVVHAYYADGSDWGVVPKKEIEIEPKIAEVDHDAIWTDGDGVTASRVELVMVDQNKWHPMYSSYKSAWATVADRRLGEYAGTDATVSGQQGGSEQEGVAPPVPVGTVCAVYLLTRYNDKVYGMALYNNEYAGFNLANKKSDGKWGLRGGTSTGVPTEQFGDLVWHEYLTDLPVSTKDPTHAGEMHEKGQDVTVKWDMNGELDEELTDKYKIQVYGRM